MKSLLLVITLITLSCTHSLPVHPNAINRIDSAAYDSLLITQAVIDAGKIEIGNNNLPAKVKPFLNTLINSYNIARQSWLAYRQLQIATNEVKLTGDIQNMNLITNQFKSIAGIK